jgi:nicotinamidase/pyrazinamidase
MKTLIIVDVQNDFIPGGALSVPHGEQVIAVINKVQEKFDLVVATQDWHPQGHLSFASNHQGKKPFEKLILNGLDQVLWPDHCVQNTWGAEFHKDLKTERIEAIFRKGVDVEIDSYSGFFDNGRKKSTGLNGYLKEKGAKDLYFVGLAGDICVYHTVVDALSEGFNVHVIEEGCRSLAEKTFLRQKSELRDRGVKYIGIY